ncbi:MAG: proteasome subunit alpha [Actinomycetota bacterium]|nr:proteasome subunit alpha [Actinomycetota bacterium]
MSMPFYVAPEQVMKDRADYARKGIARGRSLVALSFDDGILLCADNPSRTLHKIAEIYDRIAFAGVGKFSEFDSLRTAGVRAADMRGYAYSREDVDARFLANAYAQLLGNVFTHEMKPMEVEILVAEVGHQAAGDQFFRISYDGTVVDEVGSTVLGGDADTIRERLGEAYRPELDLAAALGAAVTSLAGPERTLSAGDLEVAVLAREDGRRAFRRLDEDALTPLLAAKA